MRVTFPSIVRPEPTPAAHLEQRVFGSVDEDLLEIALLSRGMVTEIGELENERIIEDVTRRRYLLALTRQLEHLLGALVHCEAIARRASAPRRGAMRSVRTAALPSAA